MKIIQVYSVGWLGLVLLAIINGTLREKGYARLMSELAAHQLSTATALLIFSAYLFMLTRIWPIETLAQGIAIGAIWLLLTVLFEFGFGHYVMGNSWERLFQDYNLRRGRIWLLLLIWTAGAPWAAYLLQK